jgi:mannose-1-phosphate guanylyltransferase
MFVVTRAHARFYQEDLNDADDSCVLVQPQNRGTGVAIATSLLHLLRAEPDAILAFFPSDHYYSDNDAFQSAVRTAVQCAQTHIRSVVLLGAEAHAPEVEYGWIEPGRVVMNTPGTPLFRVARFWEKPSLVQAEGLLRAKCLWNTFVTIGSAAALVDLLYSQIPEVMHRVSAAIADSNLEAAYREVRTVDFSREVLAPRPDRLLVLRDAASGWADMGNPARVVETLVRNRVETDWLQNALIAPHG